MRDNNYDKSKMVRPYSIYNVNGESSIYKFLPLFFSLKRMRKNDSQSIIRYHLNIDDYGHEKSLIYKNGDTIFLDRVNHTNQIFVILNSGFKDSVKVLDFIFTNNFKINLETTFYSPVLEDSLYKFNFTYNHDKRIKVGENLYTITSSSAPQISSLVISKKYFITEVYYDYSGSRAIYRLKPKKVKWKL